QFSSEPPNSDDSYVHDQYNRMQLFYIDSMKYKSPTQDINIMSSEYFNNFKFRTRPDILALLSKKQLFSSFNAKFRFINDIQLLLYKYLLSED
ncbi:25054_t:CDS:1, partial [Racocetra persica]